MVCSFHFCAIPAPEDLIYFFQPLAAIVGASEYRQDHGVLKLSPPLNNLTATYFNTSALLTYVERKDRRSLWTSHHHDHMLSAWHSTLDLGVYGIKRLTPIGALQHFHAHHLTASVMSFTIPHEFPMIYPTQVVHVCSNFFLHVPSLNRWSTAPSDHGGGDD